MESADDHEEQPAAAAPGAEAGHEAAEELAAPIANEPGVDTTAAAQPGEEEGPAAGWPGAGGAESAAPPQGEGVPFEAAGQLPGAQVWNPPEADQAPAAAASGSGRELEQPYSAARAAGKSAAEGPFGGSSFDAGASLGAGVTGGSLAGGGTNGEVASESEGLYRGSQAQPRRPRVRRVGLAPAAPEVPEELEGQQQQQPQQQQREQFDEHGAAAGDGAQWHGVDGEDTVGSGSTLPVLGGGGSAVGDYHLHALQGAELDVQDGGEVWDQQQQEQGEGVEEVLEQQQRPQEEGVATREDDGPERAAGEMRSQGDGEQLQEDAQEQEQLEARAEQHGEEQQAGAQDQQHDADALHADTVAIPLWPDEHAMPYEAPADSHNDDGDDETLVRTAD